VSISSTEYPGGGAGTTIEPTPFGRQLTLAVDAHLGDDGLRRAHRRLQRKAVVVTVWYVASYLGVLAASSLWMGAVACLSLALSMAAVGFNIQHDASHNALFATGGRRRLTAANRAAGFALNAIGGDANRWVGGHVRRHHSAPNIVGKDDDIEMAPFARLAPSQTRRPWHRYQHLYLWFVYTVTWGAIFVSDLTSTVGESITGNRHGKRPTARTYVALLASKVLFVVVMLGGPLLVHTGWSVIVGALGVIAVVGLLLGVVFQLAHAVEEAEFQCASARAEGRWHDWQVQATVDFCHGTRPVARAVTWYIGGLNYQVEHHLFPGLPHTAYPDIAPVVAEVCAQHGIAHQVQPTLRAAIRSHYVHLRTLAAA
jgi:linoleoyl-CoA desaturase